MNDLHVMTYLESLPEVDTARLPQGALFWERGRIYEVTVTEPGGFHKAREWRKSGSEEVALVPGSFPSKHLPLVARGRALPPYRSRADLLDGGQPLCFVFPTEALAMDAAYFDVALVQAPGAYVRAQSHDPAFAVTDGVHIFRLYCFRMTSHGRKTDLARLRDHPMPNKPRLHTDGPGYWRLLPSWTEAVPSFDLTQQIKPIILSASSGEETLPHIPVPPPSDTP